MSRKPPPKDIAPATHLVQAGRAADLAGSFVNPPVVHASTVLFDSAEEMLSGKTPWVYGRRGTPTLAALEQAISAIDGAAGTVICPSGLNAVATALSAFLGAGDHILIPENAYHPVHHFADTELKRFGIATTYYDPHVGGRIAELIQPRTRVVYVESPGSGTMEMQDIPAIAAAAHAAGASVIADNTWATPLYCRPMDLGADVTVLAATKYIGGHADLMLGTVSANAAAWPRLKAFHGSSGLCTGPDDVFLALRGLRTLKVRLDRHNASALTVARWLQGRSEVVRVLHPGLPEDPGHPLWRRDMSGSTGLFSFVARGWTGAQGAAFLNALSLFGLGWSWGGFESLAILARAPRQAEGPVIRLHIGLEEPEDLIADLEAGFAAVAGQP